MHVDLDNNIHSMLYVEMVKLMVNVYPKLYRKYIIIENIKPVLYSKLNKDIYIILQVVILFCRNISGNLK